MGFFGIRNPDPGDSGSDFFGLDRKARKSRNPGDRDRDRDFKISKKSRLQNLENPGDRD